MGEGNACLLGNHGMLSAGETISYAFDAAQQIEFVAGLYCGAKALGSPVLLTDGQISAVLHAFRAYRTI